MTEENKQGDNNKLEPKIAIQEGTSIPSQPVKEVKLIITKNIENGQLGVQGPGNGNLYDEPLCWWLLEKAKRFIEIHNSKMSQSSIVQPKQLSMAQQIRGMFGRK